VWPIASVSDTLQRVPLQRKIESVAADLTRRLQPGGERELPGLAGKGTRQQPMLDLRRQRQRYRPLPPLEEVGVAAVRNHHVRQEVRRQSHIGHRLLTRKSSSPNSRTPTASPRLVTGANKRAPPSSTTTSTAWAANARPCGVPTNGTRSAVSSPCNRIAPFPPEWPSRISERH
jgi:hypothetical protein